MPPLLRPGETYDAKTRTITAVRDGVTFHHVLEGSAPGEEDGRKRAVAWLLARVEKEQEQS